MSNTQDIHSSLNMEATLDKEKWKPISSDSQR